jgi:sugar/nucleoside kinase (ribokinase family)
MSLLVVGSTAIDTIATPHGKADSILGGSAVYFSLAASLFSPVRLVSVVGEDFPEEHKDLLRDHQIDIGGLEEKAGETFRWDGEYKDAMNEAITRSVHLNVFEDFFPQIPAQYQDSELVFLAQVVAADTMNLWIETEREALLTLLEKIDAIVLNDDEARQLSGENNLIKAGKWICARGPACSIIKKAEHGVLMVRNDKVFALPGYPTETVCDPTGAGDSFAGGMMGYLAGHMPVSSDAIHAGLAYGTVVASFTIEGFGPSRLNELTTEAISGRMEDYTKTFTLPEEEGLGNI